MHLIQIKTTQSFITIGLILFTKHFYRRNGNLLSYGLKLYPIEKGNEKEFYTKYHFVRGWCK